MKVAVPREIHPGERRVALIPDAVASLVKAGFEIAVEKDAGSGAFFSDSGFEAAGARVVSDVAALFGEADVVVKIHKPQLNEKLAKHEADLLREGGVLVGLLQPATSRELLERLAARRVTAFAMELVPRISRAQKMDALSSQASVAGYKAALVAACSLGKYFPMLITAAGMASPAKVLVLGAGVAGLQAIATAKRLGAMVWGYDVRAAVKEQVESLNAKFLELDVGVADAQDKGGYATALSADLARRQQDLLSQRIKEFDVVITTALVPGKRAPVLIPEEAVAGMRPGSVIVDLAAEAGGNCEVTEPDREVVRHGVTIHGPTNLASSMPIHASQLYAQNVSELLKLLAKDGRFAADFEDEVVRSTCVTHGGEIRLA